MISTLKHTSDPSQSHQFSSGASQNSLIETCKKASEQVKKWPKWKHESSGDFLNAPSDAESVVYCKDCVFFNNKFNCLYPLTHEVLDPVTALPIHWPLKPIFAREAEWYCGATGRWYEEKHHE